MVVVDGVVDGVCQPQSEVLRMNKRIVFGREIVEGERYMNRRGE